jgi:ubiquinone/menaquinone biosynthesis C-methylase UbiE
MTSDILESEWVDFKKIDALNTRFPNNSFDFIIVSNIIHHLAYPKQFFTKADRLLKPNGKLIIQEINTSLAMRIILRLMKHEGYNEKINVFSEFSPCNDPNDPWSANCSIPKLLFQSQEIFEKEFINWKIIHFYHTEFFKFVNSGGVVAKTNYIKLGFFALKIQDLVDNFLVKMFPQIFALQIQIVLQKKDQL